MARGRCAFKQQDATRAARGYRCRSQGAENRDRYGCLTSEFPGAVPKKFGDRFVELRYRAQRRRYIGDKGHEVRPSLMRKALSIVAFFLDASDFVRSWRRWIRRDWSRLNLRMRV
jgi:hypothetical protein